jgi:hypothetical protein
MSEHPHYLHARIMPKLWPKPETFSPEGMASWKASVALAEK